MIQIKRAYAPATSDDGFRVLVDRLWPRGLRKEAAALDDWMKDVAPSDDLRKWFGHQPEKWLVFRERYRQELKDKDPLLRQLRTAERKHGVLTLIYGAKDETHNQAVVLRSVLSAMTDQ